MSPRRYRFVQVDVFTDQLFGGNQLAVFLDPEGLTDQEMQAIAQEMNFAETTFVLPSTTAAAAARVRIFTPGRELPFAGHPTVGTTWVLANQHRLPAPSGGGKLALEEGIGLVPVRLEGDPDAPSVVWMSHGDARFGPPVASRGLVAEALGLVESDLLPDQPICSGTTGVSFLYVPLRTPQIVDRVRANLSALPDDVFDGERSGVFVFAPDPGRGAASVYSRMFAGETLGVPEDAATGSASGPLGAYIAERGVLHVHDPIEIVSLQGKRMGRPSTIRIRLDLRDGHATNIAVGGGVVPVLEGELTLRD
ncbi:MAG: PhzF family phenazine biosynthesis protein [Chloroflexi bacterium]|nr:PhzF family phenazine biosynthesis protein [Chloroflexota bacterium]